MPLDDVFAPRLTAFCSKCNQQRLNISQLTQIQRFDNVLDTNSRTWASGQQFFVGRGQHLARGLTRGPLLASFLWSTV